MSVASLLAVDLMVWKCERVYLLYASLRHLPRILMRLVGIPACDAQVAAPILKLWMLNA